MTKPTLDNLPILSVNGGDDGEVLLMEVVCLLSDTKPQPWHQGGKKKRKCFTLLCSSAEDHISYERNVTILTSEMGKPKPWTEESNLPQAAHGAAYTNFVCCYSGFLFGHISRQLKKRLWRRLLFLCTAEKLKYALACCRVWLQRFQSLWIMLTPTHVYSTLQRISVSSSLCN